MLAPLWTSYTTDSLSTAHSCTHTQAILTEMRRDWRGVLKDDGAATSEVLRAAALLVFHTRRGVILHVPESLAGIRLLVNRLERELNSGAFAPFVDLLHFLEETPDEPPPASLTVSVRRIGQAKDPNKAETDG